MAELSEPILYLSATIEYSTSERPLKFFKIAVDNKRKQTNHNNRSLVTVFNENVSDVSLITRIWKRVLGQYALFDDFPHSCHFSTVQIDRPAGAYVYRLVLRF